MKMYFFILIILFSFKLLAKNYELGVEAGSPTGISGKLSLGNNRAVDGLLAFSLVNDYGLNVHADYLVENAKSFEVEGAIPLELFYGIGGRLVSVKKGQYNGQLGIGPRAPVGINYNLNSPNIDFFAELALAFNIFPETNLDLEGGIGIRYRF